MIEKYRKVKLIKLLGTQPDTVLAKKFEINSCTVTRLRNKHCISKYDPYSDLWEVIEPLFGTLSARAISREYNINRWAVDTRKKKLSKQNIDVKKTVVINISNSRKLKKQKKRSLFIREQIERHYKNKTL